jgi:hypothetical protein
MRLLLAFALVCMTAGVAGAVSTSAVAPVKGQVTAIPSQPDLREGGEGFGDAFPIASLPFSDAGSTCDNFDDITLLTCGYSYYSPDVVYSYVPAASGTIDISLCGSGYDTMLGVYNSGLVEVACNDDFCGLQSQLNGVPVTAGSVIYIVVDGYYGSCGSYVISVTEAGGPCDVVCPAGGLIEGEPDCGPDYYDSYNGGCNSVGWQDICPTEGNHADMCGKSGTYTYFGLSYRDTDWFSVIGNGGTMTMTLEGEFATQLIFIYGTDCANPLYDYTTGAPCSPVSLSRTVADGSIVWPWVGPSVFSGVPCSSEYVLSLDGIRCEPTATENTSWGTIKARF